VGKPPYTNGTSDPTGNVRAMVGDAVDRLDELREAETRRVNEMTALRDKFQDKLDAAEAKRIDAIRAVDVAAVTVANDKATAQAAVLARQVTESRDTLQALVASTAAATATQLTNLLSPITERLTSLEKNQYTGEGKETKSLDMRTVLFAAATVIISVGAIIVAVLK
jgi:hypothetical protein